MQSASISYNGRISSFIYNTHDSRHNSTIVSQYKNLQPEQHLYPNDIRDKRNVHIIVMESFLDPRLIKDIEFSQSPLAEDLKKYLYGGEFAQVISPVYGGNTAQAEFELLSGVPAFAYLKSSEFNNMQGYKTWRFISKLISQHYTSLAIIGTHDGLFNSKRAYASLGFQDVNFLGNRQSDIVLFDGDVFDEAFMRLKQLIPKSDQPIISYTLGMYGHAPFGRDLDKRPNVIEVQNGNKNINSITNQFYYRTRALADHIEKIVAIDPDSIIYVTSDHLPPALNDKIQYKYDKYINISLLLDRGKPVNLSGKK